MAMVSVTDHGDNFGAMCLRPQPDLGRSGKWEKPIRLVIRVREKIPGKAVASMADRKAQNGRFRWFFEFSGFAAKMGVKGASKSILAAFFLNFCIYILHTRPDPITKRISAVPPFKWRDVSYICLPIYLLELSS